jgi:hypothetical protein
MTVHGLAIIGKSNEPLYLCDCTRILHHEQPEDTTLTPDAATPDRFGFVEANRARGLRDSLSLTHQFMMHAALDRLEELADVISPGSMVGRNMTRSASSPHWMGLLTRMDEDLEIYGYVTATNIKFLALVARPCKENVVKDFVIATHDIYIDYIMNPFSKIHEPIDSRPFDQRIQKTVRDFASRS